MSWWNNSWRYRKVITINNSGVTGVGLTDFPVMVKLDTGKFDYAKGLTAGADIRFVDSGDATSLDYEIEKWSSGNNSFLWVKVPSIPVSGNVATFNMYYGNTGAADAQNPTGVWSNQFEAVWHLSQQTGQYLDSTANHHDSDAVTVTNRTTPLIGDAPFFNGDGNGNGSNENYITFPNTLSTNPTVYTGWSLPSYTVEAFIKPSGAGVGVQTGNGGIPAGYPILSKGMAEGETVAQDVHFLVVLNATSNTIGYDYEAPFNASINHAGSGITALNTGFVSGYHVAVALQSGSNWRMFLNGGLEKTVAVTDVPNTGGLQKVAIGTATKTSITPLRSGAFRGAVDEVRISRTARSIPWVDTSSKSVNDVLLVYGSETSVTVNSVTQTGHCFITGSANGHNVTQTGHCYVSRRNSVTQTGVCNILAAPTVDVSWASMFLPATGDSTLRHQYGVFRIAGTNQVHQSGKCNIKRSNSVTQTGHCLIQHSNFVTQTGHCRVLKHVNTTQTGHYRVLKHASVTQTGICNVVLSTFNRTSRFQSGVYRIKQIMDRTQTGVVCIIDAPVATVETLSVTATDVDLNVVQGSSFSLRFIVENDDGSYANLTGYAVRGYGKFRYSDTGRFVNLSPVIASAVSGYVDLNLTSAQTAALPSNQFLYDIELYESGGYTVKIAKGKLNVYPEATA